MRTAFSIPSIALLTLAFAICGQNSQTQPQSQPQQRSPGGDVGSGAGDIGKGTAKGTGAAAKGVGKGAAHPWPMAPPRGNVQPVFSSENAQPAV